MNFFNHVPLQYHWRMKTKTLELLLVGILILSGSGCETTPKKIESDVLHEGATFTLRHPPSVEAMIDQGDGYAVHYFRIGGSKLMMGIYEGQRPRLFSKKERDLTVMRRGTTSRPNVEQGDDAWGVDSKARIWRESVWNCCRTIRDKREKAYRIPTMIHIWYFGVSEEQQAIFDAIVDTIEIK